MVLAKFDPIVRRASWLRFEPIMTTFAAHKFDRQAQPGHLSALLNDLVEAHLLGLADHVHPTLEKIVHWIETHPEPRRDEYPEEDYHWRHSWDSRFNWYKMLGLCKWLSRADAAREDFARAIKTDWEGWEHAARVGIAVEPSEELFTLTERLATALSAGQPEMGLKTFAVVAALGRLEPTDLEVPVLEFGQWACGHLVAGSKRDAEFVARGGSHAARKLAAILLLDAAVD